MVAITISILASIISGMVLFFLQKYFKKKEVKEEARDKSYAKKDALVIKSINAVGKLTVANSLALKGGKTNGEMEDALDNYKEVESEMLDFLIDNSTKKGDWIIKLF